MKKFLITTFLILGILLFLRCSKNSNPTSSSIKERYFVLYIYPSDIALINIDFWTTDISIIPTVTINGINMESFWPQGGFLEGTIFNFQYSDTISYSISSAGETTSGFITMPHAPINMSCNGISLKDDSITYITPSESYNFSWSCDNYDYFETTWYTNYFFGKKTITNRNISYDDDGSDGYELIISSYNGALLNPGSEPNVSGDYGKGYVLAQFYGGWYRLGTSNSKIQKLSSHNQNAKIRIKNYRKTIIDLILTKFKNI